MISVQRRKALYRAIGYRFALVVIAVVRVLPFRTALALGRRLGDLARIVMRRRYRIALSNLRIAYGDTITEAERRRIARESFRHWGMYAIEMVGLAFMSDEEFLRRVHVINEEHAALAVRDGQGCLLITAHLGCPEAWARWLATQGVSFVALVRRARDREMTELMTRLRAHNSIEVVTTDQSMRPVVSRLRRGGCVGILCDQNADDVFVPFFGHSTGSVSGPAVLALRTGVPILFGFGYRDGRGGYDLTVMPPYYPEQTGDQRADIERVMTEVNRQFEEAIRAHPEQWLWLHNRWRNSPIGRKCEANGEA